ncbi:type II toxin-antitoxin system VapC family toxin [Flexivirga caeni]|uniref:Ribonuclease VapC n=1 Tax=Flexivirga caeni TaxID=2294115 RepID=A0A3M9M4F9_9MICO|nr:type II toxin-antitoxin system VapC family toxin [Flexivirga caeni]RNI20451.1 PIN domain-containing protein [Flexivirga caeni]
MIVVDASVVVATLVGEVTEVATATQRLRGEELADPELVDIEVMSVLRRKVGAGELTPAKARLALNDLRLMPMRRYPNAALLDRCWELRDNLSSYDAVYVALAEALAATLVTADKRLANAPGPQCAIEVLQV